MLAQSNIFYIEMIIYIEVLVHETFLSLKFCFQTKCVGCNIVHFDEPLPRRNISIREANQINYQSSLLQPTQEKSLEETISHQMFLCGKHQIL